MKIKELKQLDDNIRLIMKSHVGIEKAITLDTLAYLLNRDKQTIEKRIKYLNGALFTILGSSKGYYMPTFNDYVSAYLDKTID